MKWKNRTADERRDHIDGFVAVTPTMTRALDVLKRCYRSHGGGHQASCSFLLGETGVGKTTVANEFLEEVRAEHMGVLMDGKNLQVQDQEAYPHDMSVTLERPNHGLIRPVLKIGVAKKTTYKQLFAQTLMAIGVNVAKATRFTEMMSIMRQQVKEQQIRMIIFDECQHIADSSMTRDPYEAADVFKVLMKEVRVQIACVGLPYATDLLLENRQLETLKKEQVTMRPFQPDFSDGSELMTFLRVLSSDLPFDRAQSIHTASVAVRLHLASDGYVSGIVMMVAEAAKIAIDEDIAIIDLKLLGEAYRRKHDVPDHENPFLVPKVDPEGFKALKAERQEEQVQEAQRNRATRRRKALVLKRRGRNT